MKNLTLFLAILFYFGCLNLLSQSNNSQTPATSLSFLQATSEETTNSQHTIHPSLDTSLNKTLTPSGIATITRTFAYLQWKEQNKLLQEINSKDPSLAETLIIFRKQLRSSSSQEEKLQRTIEAVFMHYLTNTKRGSAIEGEATTAELTQLLDRYAQSHGLVFNHNGNKQATFTLDSTTEPCKNCPLNTFYQLRYAGITVNKMRYGRNDVIPATSFEFSGNGYNLETAAILADFCHLSYFSPTFVKKQLTLQGFTSFQWIEGDATDTQVFIVRKGGYQIICFRGTESVEDVLVDLWFKKKQATGGKGAVHAGFQAALYEVWPQLERSLDKNSKIIVTGHSLGGAVAQLMANRLALTNYHVSGVYTFGSPRVGNSKFKTAYNSRLADKTFLHINNKDAVTAVPLEILGFYHLGAEERRFDTNHKITITRHEGTELLGAEERTFEQLDTKTQEEVRRKMEDVAASIERSSEFLRKSPHTLPSFSYGTTFETGALDNHRADEYLFKLACAIVEKEMKRVN